jgi:hypothetical protein
MSVDTHREHVQQCETESSNVATVVNPVGRLTLFNKVYGVMLDLPVDRPRPFAVPVSVRTR